MSSATDKYQDGLSRYSDRRAEAECRLPIIETFADLPESLRRDQSARCAASYKLSASLLQCLFFSKQCFGVTTPVSVPSNEQ